MFGRVRRKKNGKQNNAARKTGTPKKTKKMKEKKTPSSGRGSKSTKPSALTLLFGFGALVVGCFDEARNRNVGRVLLSTACRDGSRAVVTLGRF